MVPFSFSSSVTRKYKGEKNSRPKQGRNNRAKGGRFTPKDFARSFVFSSPFFRVRLDALSETGADCKLLQTYLKTQNCHVVITECSEEKTSLKRKKEQENQREFFNRYSTVYFQILSKTKPIKNRSLLDPIKNHVFVKGNPFSRFSFFACSSTGSHKMASTKYFKIALEFNTRKRILSLSVLRGTVRDETVFIGL